MTDMPPATLRDDIEIDDVLLDALRTIAHDILRDRTPSSLLPGLLRSHLSTSVVTCACGHRGDWVSHLTSVLTGAGMIARAF